MKRTFPGLDKAVACALSAAMAISMLNTAAVAAPVAEATTSLTSFHYRLTDLDASDGVAAAIQFKPLDNSGTALWLVDNVFHIPGGGAVYTNELVEGDPFAPATVVLTQSGTDGVVSKRGTDLSAKATYSATEAAQLLSTPYPDNRDSDPYRLAFSRRAFAWPQSDFFDLPFTVSPHTTVTFSARLDLDAGVDVTSLLGSEAVLRHAGTPGLIDVRASGRSFLRITDPDKGYWEGPADDYEGFATWEQVIIEPDGRTTHDSRAAPDGSYLLEVSFTNRTDQTVERALGFVMEAETTIYVQTVPENGTLLLMATGLAALGVMVRQGRTRT